MNNQVYEFLDRMGVKGILPLYSNTILPLSRGDVAGLLNRVAHESNRLTDAERLFLEKFKREFVHEMDPKAEVDRGLLGGDGADGISSQDEKYLFTLPDSAMSVYAEFIGSVEYRRANGDAFGVTHASFENHGFRLRGTVKQKLGYYIQATNGTLYGDKAFALSDPRLRTNVKFNDLGSPYFDFTEAYVRADLSWLNVEFGREYLQAGTGYSGRLILSDNAPVFDFFRIDAQYKSLRFLFVHGSLLHDSEVFPGVGVSEPMFSNKYMAMHRVQCSLFNRMNVGASEVVIYQRLSPEFAYLNPVNFFKSAEHSLRDRDNSSLTFDVELFPCDGYKVYGAWLIDDIDFSKMGTGWWGNQFGWQGGLFVTDLLNAENIDVSAEYTRIEPFVYSNRLNGNDVTHNNVSLGHHLPPNSDEWFVQLHFRPSEKLRAWLTLSRIRHGENIVVGDSVAVNVGGNVLQGHRPIDQESAPFLAGELVSEQRYGLRASFEPVTNLVIGGLFEVRRTSRFSSVLLDRFAALRIQLEY